MGPGASEPLDPKAQKFDSGHQGLLSLCVSEGVSHNFILMRYVANGRIIFRFHIFGAPVVGKIFGAADVSHDEAYLVQIGYRECCTTLYNWCNLGFWWKCASYFWRFEALKCFEYFVQQDLVPNNLVHNFVVQKIFLLTDEVGR